MGKKGKKGQAGKPKKLTPKDVGKRLDTLAKNFEEELKGADLFAPVPPTDDCAICFLPLSRVATNSSFWVCCGKMICIGCSGENKALIKKQNEKNANKKDKKPIVRTCPFCREPTSSSDREHVRRLEARALKNDHVALNILGGSCARGYYGLPTDDLKALDYWIRAAKLGSLEVCTSIGSYYCGGLGVSKDTEREALFNIVGALRGCILARHKIGVSEYESGNHEVGIRHWMIAAEAGSQPSLDVLKNIYNADGKFFRKEFISKECMDSLYRVCHDAQEEVKSEERKKHGHDDDKMMC